jgi:hypothetical protein
MGEDKKRGSYQPGRACRFAGNGSNPASGVAGKGIFPRCGLLNGWPIIRPLPVILERLLFYTIFTVFLPIKIQSFPKRYQENGSGISGCLRSDIIIRFPDLSMRKSRPITILSLD